MPGSFPWLQYQTHTEGMIYRHPFSLTLRQVIFLLSHDERMNAQNKMQNKFSWREPNLHSDYQSIQRFTTKKKA